MSAPYKVILLGLLAGIAHTSFGATQLLQSQSTSGAFRQCNYGFGYVVSVKFGELCPPSIDTDSGRSSEAGRGFYDIAAHTRPAGGQIARREERLAREFAQKQAEQEMEIARAQDRRAEEVHQARMQEFERGRKAQQLELERQRQAQTSRTTGRNVTSEAAMSSPINVQMQQRVKNAQDASRLAMHAERVTKCMDERGISERVCLSIASNELAVAFDGYIRAEPYRSRQVQYVEASQAR